MVFSHLQLESLRDIANLKERGLIEFVGSPKNGWYRTQP